MKSTRALIFAAMAVVILCGVAGLVVAERKVARDAASQAARLAPADLPQAKTEAAASGVPAAAPAGAVAEEASVTPQNTARPKPVQASGQPKGNTRNAAAAAKKSVTPTREPLKDPVARAALAFVGMDAQAEAYWYEAINDPSLSAHERQDLIEDLNEDGLSDPKRPTVDDLPLIVNRLMIIEHVGPDAMDAVNADAFQEAYKDLANLAAVAMGGGEPVR
jgi:hypothetical protein